MSLKNCELKAGSEGRARDFIRAAFPHSFSSRLKNTFPVVPFALALFCLAIAAHACGPFFPNNLLSGGDESLLAAPTANFRRELERLNLAPSRFDHVAATNGYAQQTFDAELNDLTAALRKAKVPDETAIPIIAAHRKNRDELQRYRDAHATWEATAWMDQNEHTAAKRGAEPEFPRQDADTHIESFLRATVEPLIEA